MNSMLPTARANPALPYCPGCKFVRALLEAAATGALDLEAWGYAVERADEPQPFCLPTAEGCIGFNYE